MTIRENSVILGSMATACQADPPAPARPTSLIYTLFGDFVHREPETHDELWIGALIRLMSVFHLSEAAVRQAASRMLRQGWLNAVRRGARSYYALSDRGRGRVEAISPRIYGPLVEWDGRWRLLTYTIAERNRGGRDALRKDLLVLGWAPLSASTWISPHGDLEAARAAARADGVGGDIDLFGGVYAGPRSDRELLERCWNLPAIGQRYDEFIARYRPLLEEERRRDGVSDEAAFARRMWLVHDYRKFTYVDPGLPSALLPAHWPGTAAAALFREYYAALSPKSLRFFNAARV